MVKCIKMLTSQKKFLERFIEAGYFASFANGFETAKEIFLNYLNNDSENLNKLKIL